jgi:hypothetical protein
VNRKAAYGLVAGQGAEMPGLAVDTAAPGCVWLRDRKGLTAMRSVLIATVLFPAVSAAASFERFDAPGATTTCGAVIASNGLVAGNAVVGTIVVGNAATRRDIVGGFLYRSGRFVQPKPAVPAGSIAFSGVNRFRAITGIDVDSAGLATQTFTYAAGVTSFPTIAQGTVGSVIGITDSFTILGQASVPAPPLGFGWIGFLQTAAGAVTIIDDGSGGTYPAGMDQAAAYVVGTSLNGNGAGWLFHNGTFTPIAVPGAEYTLPSGVDSKANVVGTYLTGTAPTPVEHGFRLRKGVYTTWDVPGADDTAIEDMNESGQITGCYSKNGRTHGYIYSP